MTMSAKQCYDIYAGKVDNRAYNGDPLPDFDAMGDRQKAGWQAVANAANQHESDSVVSVRKSLNDELKTLRQKNYDLRTSIAEKVAENRHLQMEVRMLKSDHNGRALEIHTVAERVEELERCQKILIGTSREHGEILAKLQGLND